MKRTNCLNWSVGKSWFLASAIVFSFGAQALTVEKICREVNGSVCADLSYEAADADRNVLVAWGSSDAGSAYSSWETAEFAKGISGAGSTRCRVTLPPEVANAAQARFFLIPLTTEPGYIRSTGQQVVVTDFYPTPKSKIVADYQWEDITTTQQRLFGVNKGLNVHHYINGSKGLSWSFSNAGNWTALDNTKFIADKSRVQITLDAKNDRVILVKNGVTAFDKGMKAQNSAAPGTQNATMPLKIFATNFATDKYGAARLYSLSCYDNDELKQNFVPHLSGSVAGFLDTVGGKFYDNAMTAPLWAGAPTTAVTASETSAAFAPATELAKLTVASTSAGNVHLSFGATPVAREIWCAWDDADKGDTFGDWAHNEYVATPAASDTTANCALPPSAVGAKAVRFFVLAAGGSYPCTYIRSDGRQAIDTGILTGNRLSVSVDLLPLCLDAVQQRVFGVSDWTNNFVQAAYINGGAQWAWSAKDHVGSWTSTGIYPELKRTQITLDVPNNLYSLAVEGRTVYTRQSARQCPRLPERS